MQKGFISSLPLVAASLGRNYGVTVTIGGDTASCDGQNINIPSLPLEVDQTVETVTRGYLDHEAAHVRFSDFDIIRQCAGNPVLFFIFNSLEDSRVDRLMGETFPGCRANLYDSLIHLFSNHRDTTGDLPATVLNWILLTANSWNCPPISSQAMFYENLINTAAPALIRAIKPILERARIYCPSCQTALDYAKEIFNTLIDITTGQYKESNRGIKQQGKNGQPDQDAQSQDGSAQAQGDDTTGQSQDGSTQAQGDTTTGQNQEGSTQTQGDDSTGADQDGSAQAQGDTTTGQSQDGSTQAQGDDTTGADQDGSAQAQGDTTTAQGQGNNGLEIIKQIINEILQNPADYIPQSSAEIMEEILTKTSQDNFSSARLVVASEMPAPVMELHECHRRRAENATLTLRRTLQSRLQANRLKHNAAGRRGRINTNALHKVFASDPKVFIKASPRIAINTALHVLVDCSASMRHQIDLVRESAFAISHALGEIDGLNVAVSAFPGLPRHVGGCGEYATVTPILRHGQRLHNDFFFPCNGTTPLGEALWWTGQQMARLNENRKIILIITDGAPDNDANARAAINALSQDLEIYALGIRANVRSLAELLQNRFVLIDDINQLPTELFSLLGSALIEE